MRGGSSLWAPAAWTRGCAADSRDVGKKEFDYNDYYNSQGGSRTEETLDKIFASVRCHCPSDFFLVLLLNRISFMSDERLQIFCLLISSTRLSCIDFQKCLYLLISSD